MIVELLPNNTGNLKNAVSHTIIINYINIGTLYKYNTYFNHFH